MPPFDIDIYSLLPIIINKCDRQYCLYKNKKILCRIGRFFRRVSYSVNGFYTIFQHDMHLFYCLNIFASMC